MIFLPQPLRANFRFALWLGHHPKGNARLMYSLVCTSCRSILADKAGLVTCPDCAGTVGFDYSPDAYAVLSDLTGADRSMWRYRDLLPVSQSSRIVTLGEGQTPLQAARLYPEFGLYYKNEAMNPTGSVKDRAISVAITKAVEFGFDTVMLYSDGSTALSSSAYAARAGLRHVTVVPKDTPDNRLLPMALFNSLLVEFLGSQSQALDWAHQACQELGFYESTTYRKANPYQSEGPKTIAYEIVAQLGEIPDWVVVPIGGGGTLAGIWRGFREIQTRRQSSKLPRMVGMLPVGYSMLAEALKRGIQSDAELRQLAPASPPPTIQVKLAMSFSPDGLEAISVIRDSKGLFLSVSDEEARAAQLQLASCEGVYAELSGAVALVGAEKLISSRMVSSEQSIVAMITGSGFRETAQLAGLVAIERIPLDPKDGASRLKDLLSA